MAENAVSGIINSPLFGLDYSTLLAGGNTLWTKRPLPECADALVSIRIPKPDKHFGFQQTTNEIKSEATNGTLFAAEAQAAGAGAHRVNSLLWLLDEVDPDRKRACTDAIAFTTVVSQRQAVAYVNYYDLDKKLYHMSFIDSFYFLKDADAQGCRDHHRNVAEWMLNIMQPTLRDLLSRAWTKVQSASTVAGGND